MDTFEKRLVRNLDAMFKTAELFSIEEYSQILEISVSSLKKHISIGIKQLVAVTDNEYTLFSENTFIDNMGCLYGFDMLDELQNYIHSQDLSVWENVPKRGKRPNPREFINYILNHYRKDFFRHINLYSPFGRLRPNCYMDYDLFRIRKYDYHNRIIEEVETDTIGEYLREPLDSDTVSRIVICGKEEILNTWFILKIIRSISNEHITVNRTAEWETAFYDRNDNILATCSDTGCVSRDELMLETIARNATYAVLSYRERQDRKKDGDFTVQYILMNNGDYKRKLLPVIKNIMEPSCPSDFN